MSTKKCFLMLFAVMPFFSHLAIQNCSAQEIEITLYTATSEVGVDKPLPLILEIRNGSRKKLAIGKAPIFERQEALPEGLKMAPELSKREGPKADGNLYVSVKCLVPPAKGSRLPSREPGPHDAEYLEVKAGEAAFYKISVRPGFLVEDTCVLEVLIQDGEKIVARSNSLKIKGLTGQSDNAPKQK